MSRAYHGEQGEEYYDARTNIYSKLDVKHKKLEKEYADKVNSIVGRGDAIKNEIEDLNSYEAEFTAMKKKVNVCLMISMLNIKNYMKKLK